MDKKTVFLDGLVLPRALKVLDHGVLVGEPPHLWLARDTNGDLKADTKELVIDTYGQRDGEHRAQRQQPDWALDNWMYTSEHNGYLRLKDGKFDIQPTLHGASGARHKTMPGASIGTRTKRRCSSICCPRGISCAIRTWCGRAAATNRW